MTALHAHAMRSRCATLAPGTEKREGRPSEVTPREWRDGSPVAEHTRPDRPRKAEVSLTWQHRGQRAQAAHAPSALQSRRTPRQRVATRPCRGRRSRARPVGRSRLCSSRWSRRPSTTGFIESRRGSPPGAATLNHSQRKGDKKGMAAQIAPESNRRAGLPAHEKGPACGSFL